MQLNDDGMAENKHFVHDCSLCVSNFATLLGKKVKQNTIESIATIKAWWCFTNFKRNAIIFL